jgi:hypothetical protein
LQYFSSSDYIKNNTAFTLSETTIKGVLNTRRNNENRGSKETPPAKKRKLQKQNTSSSTNHHDHDQPPTEGSLQLTDTSHQPTEDLTQLNDSQCLEDKTEDLSHFLLMTMQSDEQSK